MAYIIRMIRINDTQLIKLRILDNVPREGTEASQTPPSRTQKHLIRTEWDDAWKNIVRQTFILSSKARIPAGVFEGRATNSTMDVVNASHGLSLPATHSKPLLVILPLYKASHVSELLRVSGDVFVLIQFYFFPSRYHLVIGVLILTGYSCYLLSFLFYFL